MKNEQIVGVYYDYSESNHVVYSFKVISESEHAKFLQGHSNLSLEAVFVISEDEFDDMENQKWQISCPNPLYVDRVEISPLANKGVIYDVLSDFMAINANERGAVMVRVKAECDSELAMTIRKNGYSFVGENCNYSFFERDVRYF